MKKNLLYITHGSNDFMDDMLFLGLKDLKDKYNIYYAISGWEKSEEVKDIETRRDNITYGWKNDWYSVAKSLNPVDYTIKYDLCIVGQAWKQNQKRFFELRHLLSRDCKIAQIYALDDRGPQVEIRVPFNTVFGLNIIDDWYYGSYLPFCCPPALALKENNSPIKYMINCQLGPTHPSRMATCNEIFNCAKHFGVLDKSLISLWGHNGDTLIGNSPRTPTDKYWETLEQSKIIVHERGQGMDAFRFWEAIATGNIVLCSPRNLYLPNGMPIPPNVVVWNDLSLIHILMEQLLQIPDEKLQEIRISSKEFVKEHHLPIRRLEKIIRLTDPVV